MMISPIESRADGKGKKIADFFFKVADADSHKYACNICNDNVLQNKKKGYSNLTSHLNRKHAGWQAEMEAAISEQRSLIHVNFLTAVTDTAKNVFGWLDLIVNGDMPFTIVENRLMAKYLNLESVSRSNTLRPVFEKLILRVRDKLKAKLPSHFGVIFDGTYSFRGLEYSML